MKIDEPAVNQIVRVKELASSAGMMVGREHVEARREGATGRVTTFSEGVVFVKHGDTTGAYWAYELELVGEPA